MKNAKIISNAKSELRQQIFQQKREIGLPVLHLLSNDIILRLESTLIFREANHILFYHSLPFEVVTTVAIEKWHASKEIYLPVVVGEELQIKKYSGKDETTRGSFGVVEPTGILLENYNLIDLVIVPGVAFDKQKKRMGYGKGFYDKLLPKIKAKKAGICFDFQLFEQIPADIFDQSVDIILTESQILL